jgi:hypothetical protein
MFREVPGRGRRTGLGGAPSDNGGLIAVLVAVGVGFSVFVAGMKGAGGHFIAGHVVAALGLAVIIVAVGAGMIVDMRRTP